VIGHSLVLLWCAFYVWWLLTEADVAVVAPDA